MSMDLCDVVKQYMAVRDLLFKESTIKTAWQKSGINSLNPEIFSEADFAPSIASSTKMQLPASYPTQLSRGPDVASSDAEFNGEVLKGRERRRNAEGSDSDYRTDESLLESSDESDDSEGPSCHHSLSPPQDRDLDTLSTPLTQSHQITAQTRRTHQSDFPPWHAWLLQGMGGFRQAKEDDVCRQAKEKEGTEFEGSLNSKNKIELEDIAFSLGLDIDATAIVLKIRIDAHFNATPSLKQDPRYVGLFTRKRKRAPVPSENDDIRPSLSQRLLSPVLSPNPQSPSPSYDFLHHRSHSPPLRYHLPSPLLHSNFPRRQFGSTVNNFIPSSSSTHPSNNTFPHYNLNISPTPIIPQPQPHSSTSTAPHTSSFPYMYIPSYHHPFTSQYNTHSGTYSQPENPLNNA
ncbi:hypothetical protein C8J55DRAFT_558596 [Lentinula edodes]|uniref:Uncharacterized protein n=1 Tax=Lentinula lateritia TaxID=40482 RepID=A0A9W9AMQ1_9AGAR|nr:hypothetical protein C8J55DRAFT_558596 [Lentinula edodes]